jgi:hypothetical protein
MLLLSFALVLWCHDGPGVRLEASARARSGSPRSTPLYERHAWLAVLAVGALVAGAGLAVVVRLPRHSEMGDQLPWL